MGVNFELLKPIARFRSPFKSKFGIPKQSGLVEELEGEVAFEKTFRDADSLRGIEGFDYLWLIWGFSANSHAATSPVVRPPVLGGNTRVGVFATRSPFRPNALGLSSVRLSRIEWETSEGPIIHVLGADLMDGTPIYDIKPYIAYADSHPEARSGFVDHAPMKRLQVEMPESLGRLFTGRQLAALRKTLELDPRPHYQHDENKTYGMEFGPWNVKFRVAANGVLTVVDCAARQQRTC